MAGNALRQEIVKSRKASRYAAALESSPELLAQLQEAAEETLSLRDEVAAARAVLGETIRGLGRATSANDGVMPQGYAALVMQQLREVNSLVASCAAIEAKRVDQQFDAAKMIMLVGKLRTDICVALKNAGMLSAVPFVHEAFSQARWTGALDQAAVDEALAAPASFDIKFRPIERDAQGKLLEHKQAFDTPEDALNNARDLDLTARSAQLADSRVVDTKPVNPAPKTLARVEDDALRAELEQTNDMLDAEIEAAKQDAKDNGQPLPGMESR